jgi:hypothetical protein
VKPVKLSILRSLGMAPGTVRIPAGHTATIGRTVPASCVGRQVELESASSLPPRPLTSGRLARGVGGLPRENGPAPGPARQRSVLALVSDAIYPYHRAGRNCATTS